MTELVKGHANMSRLAIQGHYRDVTAQEMAKIHARTAHSNSITCLIPPQSAFHANAIPGDIKTTHRSIRRMPVATIATWPN